ncbi:hypothetical protein LINPERHAP2_LOCUS41451, partial [Linum perenne]
MYNNMNEEILVGKVNEGSTNRGDTGSLPDDRLPLLSRLVSGKPISAEWFIWSDHLVWLIIILICIFGLVRIRLNWFGLICVNYKGRLL